MTTKTRPIRGRLTRLAFGYTAASLLVGSLVAVGGETGGGGGGRQETTIARDKAGKYDRARVAMDDGREFTVLSTGNDVVAAVVGAPGAKVGLRAVDYGVENGAAVELSVAVPDDPTQTAEDAQARLAEIAAADGGDSEVDALDDALLAEATATSADNLEAWVASKGTFRSPGEVQRVQVVPGLAIHSAYRINVSLSKVKVIGDMLRYIVPASDPNRTYVYDESQTDCDAIGGDRLQLCTGRVEYGNSNVIIHRRGPAGSTPALCASSYTVGFAYGGFNMGVTQPICDASYVVEGISYRYQRVTWDSGHPRGAEGWVYTPSMVLVSRPNGQDTLVTYSASARTCGLITCTTYGSWVASRV